MSYVFTAIVFIVIFSLLILIHELGHFWAAKRSGIKVEEFGLGLPPKIWGKKFGETVYSFNWIPFGGFVRLFGEDSYDPSILKKKRSFAAASSRNRFKVAFAGVFMNFFLAWFLLSIGFSVGMKPLIGPNEVFDYVDSGHVQLVEGLKIKNVENESLAQYVGMKKDDLIYFLDGKNIGEEFLMRMNTNPVGAYKVKRGEEILSYEVTDEMVEKTGLHALGVVVGDTAAFPRIEVFKVDPAGVNYAYGLRDGDIVLSVNEKQVFYVDQFESLIRGVSPLEYEIYRNGERQKVIVEVPQTRKVVVSDVLAQSPAAEAGIKPRDVILSVNGTNVTDSLELIKYVSGHATETIAYAIDRDGEKLFFAITSNEDKKIGVLLSELMNYKNFEDMSLYNVNVVSSVAEVKDEKYPVHIALYKSFTEMVKVSKLTAESFGAFVGSLITNGQVPNDVAGPVGIARMTHTFAQQGIIALLRFVAVLSLSLAVINILPLPGLDGGRIFFIIGEVILGKRMSRKIESRIHVLGYFLILIMIFVVTYSDIVRLIKGE
ncbi:MAG: RIP metalloprotease RseP [Candidatus Peregrinibacteria bacterium]|nr:RIP metalloprotease RseP [Candidatus Peregrinibacteria bacterium]